MSERTPEVVVVGAGPVGLSCALQLGRAGRQVRVLERRPAPSDQPRAHVVNARTMELFRAWGVADGVRADGLHPSLARSFGWLTEVNAPEFAALDHLEDTVAERYTPERLCSCAQDLVEGRLLAAVKDQPAVSVEYGAEVLGLKTDADGAVLRVTGAGATCDVRARYVVAADGASSPTRGYAGMGLESSAPLGRRLNVYFHADLRHWTRSRPHILWFVHHVDTQGILIALDGSHRWVYSVELPPGEQPADYPAQRCRDLVRAAVGAPDLEPEILSMLAWDVDMAVADSFRSGPVFLVGDAAHRFPPMGGFGMNSGIQDAHNLAWKLALVLEGLAGERLLDTYDAERRPVAAFNAAQCMLNAERQRTAAAALAEPATLALLAAPEGAALRAGVAAGVAELSEEFHSLGQQFGHVYEGAGVLDDGSPARPSTVTEYVATARPGARAPHARLRTADGRVLSTVDLFADGWNVLSAGSAADWAAAARRVTQATGLPVGTSSVHDDAGAGGPGGLSDADEPGRWRALYELDEGGAVLVRPDGHVGARWASRPPDTDSELARVVGLLLRT